LEKEQLNDDENVNNLVSKLGEYESNKSVLLLLGGFDNTEFSSELLVNKLRNSSVPCHLRILFLNKQVLFQLIIDVES
jgi:hypothetical protein